MCGLRGVNRPSSTRTEPVHTVPPKKQEACWLVVVPAMGPAMVPDTCDCIHVAPLPALQVSTSEPVDSCQAPAIPPSAPWFRGKTAQPSARARKATAHEPGAYMADS